MQVIICIDPGPLKSGYAELYYDGGQFGHKFSDHCDREHLWAYLDLLNAEHWDSMPEDIAALCVEDYTSRGGKPMNKGGNETLKLIGELRKWADLADIPYVEIERRKVLDGLYIRHTLGSRECKKQVRLAVERILGYRFPDSRQENAWHKSDACAVGIVGVGYVKRGG